MSSTALGLIVTRSSYEAPATLSQEPPVRLVPIRVPVLQTYRAMNLFTLQRVSRPQEKHSRSTRRRRCADHGAAWPSVSSRRAVKVANERVKLALTQIRLRKVRRRVASDARGHAVRDQIAKRSLHLSGDSFDRFPSMQLLPVRPLRFQTPSDYLRVHV